MWDAQVSPRCTEVPNEQSHRVPARIRHRSCSSGGGPRWARDDGKSKPNYSAFDTTMSEFRHFARRQANAGRRPIIDQDLLNFRAVAKVSPPCVLINLVKPSTNLDPRRPWGNARPSDVLEKRLGRRLMSR